MSGKGDNGKKAEPFPDDEDPQKGCSIESLDPQKGCSFEPLLKFFEVFSWLGEKQAVITGSANHRRRQRGGPLVTHALFYYQSYQYSQAHVTDLHIHISRQPLHLVVVLDMNKGILAQGKLDLIRLTLKSLIEHLHTHDSISLCTWDSGVTSFPTIKLTDEGVRQMYKVIDNLHPPRDPETTSSLTRAISIGLERIHQLEQQSMTSISTSLVLITDGGPLVTSPTSNSSPEPSPRRKEGLGLDVSSRAAPPPSLPSSPRSKPDRAVVAEVLGSLAQQDDHHQLPIHAFEIGGKTQEGTLQQVVKGRGTYNHICRVNEVDAKVEACIKGLLATTTDAVVLTLEALGGCEILELHSQGCPVFAYRERFKYSISFGSMYDDQSRDVLASVSLPIERRQGEAHVGRLTLEYKDMAPGNKAGTVHVQTEELMVVRAHIQQHHPSDLASPKGLEGETSSHVGPSNTMVAYQVLVMATPRTISEAYELHDLGKTEEAVALLNDYVDRLTKFDRHFHTAEMDLFSYIREVKKAVTEIGLEKDEEKGLDVSSQSGGKPSASSPPHSPSRLQLGRGNNFFLTAPLPSTTTTSPTSSTSPMATTTTGRSASARSPVVAGGNAEILSIKTRETDRGTESIVTTPQQRAHVLKRLASSPITAAGVMSEAKRPSSTKATTVKSFFGGMSSSNQQGRHARSRTGSPSPPPSPADRGTATAGADKQQQARSPKAIFANQIDISEI